MKEVKVVIERSSDAFSAFAENVEGVSGMGDTVQEAKDSLIKSIVIQNELGNTNLHEYRISYKFDVQSLLKYYKGIFTKSALERITGINQKQLSHYANGVKKPRRPQIEKIETALHRLGEELLTVEL